MCPPYVPSLKPWMRLAVENEWPKYDAGRNVIPHSTVWPEILAGNLFWRIGGFERNPPIFLPPKFVQS